MYEALFFCLAGVFGYLAGVFADVAYVRLMATQEPEYVSPPRCGVCGGAAEVWTWLVPGRCARCGGRLPRAPGTMRWAAAAAFAAGALRHPTDSASVVVVGFFMVGLLLIWAIDDAVRLVPDEVTVAGVGGGLLAVFLFPRLMEEMWPYWAVGGRVGALLAALTASAAGAAFIVFVMVVGRFLLRREAMGSGDAFLLAYMGALLGPQYLAIAFFIACFLGTARGLPILLSGKRWVEVAFGPFLAMAGIVMTLAGRRIAHLLLVEYPRLFLPR